MNTTDNAEKSFHAAYVQIFFQKGLGLDGCNSAAKLVCKIGIKSGKQTHSKHKSIIYSYRWHTKEYSQGIIKGAVRMSSIGAVRDRLKRKAHSISPLQQHSKIALSGLHWCHPLYHLAMLCVYAPSYNKLFQFLIALPFGWSMSTPAPTP